MAQSTVQKSGDPVPEYAVLLERLRGSEDETVLSEAAAELMRQPFAEEEVEAVISGSISQLQEAERKRAFALIQEKVARLGITDLSSEEKALYLQALGRRLK